MSITNVLATLAHLQCFKRAAAGTPNRCHSDRGSNFSGNTCVKSAQRHRNRTQEARTAEAVSGENESPLAYNSAVLFYFLFGTLGFIAGYDDNEAWF